MASAEAQLFPRGHRTILTNKFRTFWNENQQVQVSWLALCLGKWGIKNIPVEPLGRCQAGTGMM